MHLRVPNLDDFSLYSTPLIRYYHTGNPTQIMADPHDWQIPNHNLAVCTASAPDWNPQGIPPNDILNQWRQYHR